MEKQGQELFKELDRSGKMKVLGEIIAYVAYERLKFANIYKVLSIKQKKQIDELMKDLYEEQNESPYEEEKEVAYGTV